MATHSGVYDSRREEKLSNTIVGIFATKHDAREAIKRLRGQNFKQTWLGITRPADRETGEPQVEDTDVFARFMSPDRVPLHSALLEQGVSESQARQIETDIAPGCAIVTVYGEDNPSRASELLSENNGYVVEADTETPSAVKAGSAHPRAGVDRDERRANDERDPRDPEYAHDEFEFVESGHRGPIEG